MRKFDNVDLAAEKGAPWAPPTRVDCCQFSYDWECFGLRHTAVDRWSIACNLDMRFYIRRRQFDHLLEQVAMQMQERSPV